MIKDVVGYEGLYTCNEYGNVFSCVTNSSRRKKLMSQNIRNGYYYVNSNNKKEVNHINCIAMIVTNRNWRNLKGVV